MGHYYRQTMMSDVHETIPKITSPTLVLNRSGNRIVPIEHSKDVAARLPDAKFVELPGEDHLIFSQDIDRVADEIEEFLTGSRTGKDPDRLLTTLLFTDIVDSTKRAAEWGDRRWRDLLDQHHALVRVQLERYGGREVVNDRGRLLRVVPFADAGGPLRARRGGCRRRARRADPRGRPHR